MRWNIPLLIIYFLGFIPVVLSAAPADSLRARLDSLEMQIKILQEKAQQEQLQALRTAAGKQVSTKEDQTEYLPSKTFQERSRAMQVLNPEISVTGDMIGKYLTETPHYTDEERTGFQFRVAEVAVQSNLDPFSMAKVILEFSPEEIGLAEAYITWVNPLPKIYLTAGKFRQQFGVVNRCHAHALDQIYYPLPISLYMGEEGLNQLGISASWLMPSITAPVNEMILEITNAGNEILFSGEKFSLPSMLMRFKNYYDLSPDTYLEWGVSGMAGTNDSLGFTLAESHRWTYLAGLDLTLSWRPLNRALYRGLVWRSELFYVEKEETGVEQVNSLGGYSYLDYRLDNKFLAGIRGDFAQPLMPDNKNHYLWQVVPYVTFWQSEYVFLRLEYTILRGKNLEARDGRFTLQLNWSMGPHRHEKY